MARFKTKLFVSDRMTEQEEEGIVRMPLKAREFSSSAFIKEDVLRISCGKEKIELTIKQVYKEDLREINRQINKDILKPEDKNVCCFLSQVDFDVITHKRGKYNPWVTNELEPIMIGADPEFVLVDNEDVVRASDFLPFDDKFGSDSNWAELRPDPSQDVIEVVNNISGLFLEGNEAVDKLDWMAGACYPVDPSKIPYLGKWCPIGGHIHLGNPDVEDGVNHDMFRDL